MEEHNNHSAKGNQSQIVGAIVLAGAMIAGAILLKGTTSNTVPAQGNANPTEFQGKKVSADDHILGNPKAKIVIVEYSDTECPFCKTFHNTMKRVIEERGNEVAWVYRHYPIPQLHPDAAYQAEATECAWAQGGNEAFWTFTNRLFEITPSNNGLDRSELPKIALYAGLDVTEFNTCLENGTYKEKIAESIKDANKAGVRGTPSSFLFVNGKLVDSIGGAQPYEAVIEALESAK